MTGPLSGLEVMVDLQTGTISLVIPREGDAALELETVTADDEFAPQED